MKEKFKWILTRWDYYVLLLAWCFYTFNRIEKPMFISSIIIVFIFSAILLFFIFLIAKIIKEKCEKHKKKLEELKKGEEKIDG